MFFSRKQNLRHPGSRHAPPEFRWIEISMDVTRWVITGTLGTMAVGIWAGAMRLNDLHYTVKQSEKQMQESNAVNAKQDQEINDLKRLVAEHRVYLEQILEAVRNKQS